MRLRKEKLYKIEDVRILESDKARELYINSDYSLYKDKEGIYYLDILGYGALIEPVIEGTLKDIEQYLIEEFNEMEKSI